MREIKFRAWTGVQMEYRVLAGVIGAFYVPGLDPNDSASVSPMNTKYSEQTPIMQFTGLHDKNGKEIYEGDVVQRKVHRGDISHTRDYHEEVYWREECSGFEFVAVEKNDDGSRESWMPNWDTVALVYEIIGNIYENPELLKEKA
jgi:uncharacterized phage protein (TIGR01671 family)